MKICPKCGYREPPHWRVCRWDNPEGELEVCHISDLEFNNPKLAQLINTHLGKVVTDKVFAYFMGKRARYVKRIWKQLFEEGGQNVFLPHYEWTKYKESRGKI